MLELFEVTVKEHLWEFFVLQVKTNLACLFMRYLSGEKYTVEENCW